MRYLKQSTSVDLPIGPFLDATDAVTAETALTITQPDVRLKKNGAAWAEKAAAQTLSHEENGYYEVTLDATDTNTLGLLRLNVSESGAMPVWEDFMVMPANVWDSLFGADLLQTDVIEWHGSNLQTGTGPLHGLGIIDRGSAQNASATTLQMRTAAPFANSEVIGAVARIMDGTGAGQTRATTANVGSTDTLTVPVWTTTPSPTTPRYELYGVPAANLEAAIAADPTIVKLAAMINGTPQFNSTALALAPTGAARDIIASGTATSAGSTNTFIDTAQIGTGVGAFEGARVYWKSGPNTKRSVRILSFDNDTGAFVTDPMQSVGSGNAYDIVEDAAAILAEATHAGAVLGTDAIPAAAISTGGANKIRDAILDFVLGEPAGVFSWAGATVKAVIAYIGAKGSNKMTQTATTQTLRNRADSATIATSTVSDNGVTSVKGSDT